MGDLLAVTGCSQRQRRAPPSPHRQHLGLPAPLTTGRDTALSLQRGHIKPLLPRRQGEAQTAGTTGNCVPAGRMGTNANQTEVQPAVQPLQDVVPFRLTGSAQ